MRLLGGAALLALLGPALLAAAPALAQGTHAEPSEHEHCVATIENTGEAALSPGVWLVHHDRDVLWGPGLPAGGMIELLVETGANLIALGIVEPGGNHRAMAIPTIPPGLSVSFDFDNEPGGVYLSTINKLMDSNDSFVGVANEHIFSESGGAVLEEWELAAFDAGTEENEPRGGGFAAGQPDITRGLANVANGVPTVGGVITENTPQYGSAPQALLTVRCEMLDITHEEAVAIREAGGDPYASDASGAGGRAPDADYARCEAVLENTGAAPLAPGVWTLHHDRDALWGPGLPASAAFEQLVEGANPAMAVARGMKLVDTLLPGASARFSFDNAAGDEVYLSTASMIFDSNDSFVGVANVRVFTDPGETVPTTFDLFAWDAGTEENQPRGGGFAAGQPDVTRGTANFDNGAPTDGGVITENNPQYGNAPQARLTLRCETAAGADVPPEPAPGAVGETPAEPPAATDGEMPPEPRADGDEPPATMDGDAATAPRTGTGLAPAGGGGPTRAVLLTLAAAVVALGSATLAVRRSRR